MASQDDAAVLDGVETPGPDSAAGIVDALTSSSFAPPTTIFTVSSSPNDTDNNTSEKKNQTSFEIFGNGIESDTAASSADSVATLSSLIGNLSLDAKDTDMSNDDDEKEDEILKNSNNNPVSLLPGLSASSSIGSDDGDVNQQVGDNSNNDDDENDDDDDISNSGSTSQFRSSSSSSSSNSISSGGTTATTTSTTTRLTPLGGIGFGLTPQPTRPPPSLIPAGFGGASTTTTTATLSGSVGLGGLNGQMRRVLLASPARADSPSSSSSSSSSPSTTPTSTSTTEGNGSSASTPAVPLSEAAVLEKERERIIRSGEIQTMALWRNASNARTALLDRILLDSESPQLNSAMIEHWLSDDANLSTLLEFISRPLDNKLHEGAGPLGQDSVAAVAFGVVPKLPPVMTDFDLAYSQLTHDHGASSNGSSSGAGAKTEGGAKTAATFAAAQKDLLSVYGVEDFVVTASSHHNSASSHQQPGASGVSSSSPSHGISGAALALATAGGGGGGIDLNTSSASSVIGGSTVGDPDVSIRSGRFASFGGGGGNGSDTEGGDDDGSEFGDSRMGSSVGGGHGGHGSGSSESTAMAQAITQVHAASFAAAIADLVPAGRVFTKAVSTDNNDTKQHDDESNSGSTTTTTPAGKGTSRNAVSSSTPPSSWSSSSSSSSSSAVRPVSLLFPRVDQEVNSLRNLRDRLEIISSHVDNSSFISDSIAKKSTSSASSPSSSSTQDDVQNVVVELLSSMDLPTSAQADSAAEIESAAAKRGYRLTRMLCGGTSGADELLHNRVDEITRAMFNVFSSRYKGSFYHACSVLQRLVQYQPDALARSIASDSQRYIGAMMSYLHHPPVADTLVQIVLLSHLTSSSGGAGPSASMTGSGMGGGFGGMGGGMGLGMGGLLFGGMRDRGLSLTTYEGPMNMYSSRGSPATGQARTTLYRSLAGWGFLAVLGAHIYRPEFAPCSEHVVNASEAFLQILKAFSTDERADILLTVFATVPNLLRGLIQGCVSSKPGFDYPHPTTGTTTLPGSQDTYCGPATDGTVPVRQRVCMKVVAEVATLAFQDTVPQPQEPGSGPMGGAGMLGGAPRMLENKVAKYSTSIASSLVSALPRLGAALVRIHRTVHPEVPTLAGKAHKVSPGGGNTSHNQSGGGSSAAGGSSSTTALGAATNGASEGEKKKKKKKKKKSKGGANSAASAITGGGSGGPNLERTDSANTPGSDGEDDDVDDAPSSAAATPATPGSPTPADAASAATTASGSSSSSSSMTTPKHRNDDSSAATTTAPNSASSVGGNTTSHGGGHGGASSAAAAAAAAGGKYLHSGYSYKAPFGTYRISAFQLLAALASREAMIPKPEPWPLPPTLEELQRLAAAGENGNGVAGINSLGDTSSSFGGVGGSGGASSHNGMVPSGAASTVGSVTASISESASRGTDSQHHRDSIGGSGKQQQNGKSKQTGKDAPQRAAEELDEEDFDDHSSQPQQEEGSDLSDTGVASGKGHTAKGGNKKHGKGKKNSKTSSSSSSSSAKSTTSSKRSSTGSNGRKNSGSMDEDTFSTGRGRSVSNASGGSIEDHDGHSGVAGKRKSKRGSLHTSGGANGHKSKFGFDHDNDGNDSDHEPIEQVHVWKATLDALSTAAYLAGPMHGRGTLSGSALMMSTTSAAGGRTRSGSSSSSFSAAASYVRRTITGGSTNTTNTPIPSSPVGNESSSAALVVASSSATATTTNSASHHRAAVTASGYPAMETSAGVPLVFDPAEFWGCAVTWVTLYAHTNMYHSSFFTMLRAALKSNHEAALQHAFLGGRLISSFVHHYKETAPAGPALPSSSLMPVPPPPALPPHFSMGSPASTSSGADSAFSPLALASPPPIPPTSSHHHPAPIRAVSSQRTTGNTAARGTILRTLNAIRLVSASQHPSTFLCQHLQGHSLWSEFQPILKADTGATMKPLIPTARAKTTPAAQSDSLGGLSALQTFLSPAAYSALLGPSGLNLLGKKGNAAAAAALAEKAKNEANGVEEELEWNLGSSFAKELGLDGINKYVDTPSSTVATTATSAAATVTAAVTASGAGKGGASAKNGNTKTTTSSSSGAGNGETTTESKAAAAALATLGKKGGNSSATTKTASSTSIATGKGASAPISSALEAFTSTDLLGVD